MVEIRCKNCGGLNRIETFSEETECEYCFGLIELDEDHAKFMNLYRKADDAWNRQDFDEALSLYEQIVEEDASQSEAHWGAALCRYGVSYVTDPYRGNKMPTCNRVNRTSILQDKNYLAAIKYAPARTREQYEIRAREIDRIAQEFLKIVDQEKPYDVFISYKNRGEDGKRTLDAQVAKKLYLFLKEKGIKVFFAEETLKSVAGSMFEPYIFAALTSAKVMVLFGSSRENVESTWVKNEWRRYLALAQEDPNKTLIPAHIGDFYKVMPMELGAIQGYDAMSPVFNEEITEFVKIKIADSKKPESKKGVDLAARHAPQAKVDKLVAQLDCEEELAVSALVLFQGNVDKATNYICEDPEYKKKRWQCSECGSVNTHDSCRKCGVSKKQSAELARQREELERRERLNSAEHKRAVAQRTSRIIKIVVSVAVAAAVLALVVFLGSKVVGFFGDLIHQNQSTDQLYTPEIVQTYVGTYSNGDAILTFTECSQDGVLQGTFAFVVDEEYGQYEITGTITDKKNSGELTMTITAGEWIIRPSGFNTLDEFTITISRDHNSISSSKYSLKLTAGEFTEYNISTVDDLQKLSGASGMYTLKNDIDLSGVAWTPIEGFTGTLVGGGYTIKNMTIEADGSNIGFFGTLEGSVTDLNFENASVTVTGRNENIGILCGYLTGSALNVSVSGVVDARTSTNVGGVAGHIYKLINGEIILNNLSSSATVTGLAYAGGIAGKLHGSYVSMSLTGFVNSGTVTAGEDYAGGLAGYAATTDNAEPLTIYDSENTGDVTGRYYVGGLVGCGSSNDTRMGSIIRDSSCSANITGEAYVGCIAGSLQHIPIDSCSNAGSTLTATGSVTEDNVRCAYVGGFVGAGGNVSNCTNEVPIAYTGSGAYVGGVIGYADISISPDYLTLKNVTNNADISGADYVGGIIGYAMCEYMTFQVENASNTANITGSGDYVGGIVGFCRAADYDGYVYIYDSTNTGDVSGNSYVGGIVGYGRANYEGSVISGCSSTGTVSGKSDKGNIAGKLEVLVIS